ncbi:MAG: trypsin-like peptidase domain-containing protein [Gemmataceae bacterium]|nr:trypsin-like peptidase domain-containing protein [Gemmataceae bacterium]
MNSRLLLSVSCLLATAVSADAQGVKTSRTPATFTVEQLAEKTRDSIVIIHHTGREGKRTGLGAGFVVAADGLIATNLHVIGDARPITVQLADGTKHDVVAVHASDRSHDLALVKIDAKNLKPLSLGNSDAIKVGQAIAALGHPRGLEHSVVAGVLSGKRDVEGIPMLQIAMPIEQGNSGGPVLDQQGRVIGVVTMKSLVTANLGFAVPVNALKTILRKPNPVPMERWLTIGVLDKAEWKTIYGGRWRQRAGRIIADGMGTGFGGRTLCFWQRPAPDAPYDIAVTVKLDDESGAAGLIFGGDDRDRHYGFYPSGGKLRLTRFNGPDVFSWKILQDIPTPHYRPGEWNTLRVRIEKDKFVCYVNEQQVAEWGDLDLAGATVGLAKFRETVAEFKRFAVGANLAAKRTPPEALARLQETIAGFTDKEVAPGALAPLLKTPGDSMHLLRERARQLEMQAAQLRKLAQTVHVERTLQDLGRAVEPAEPNIDLLSAALLLARLDNEELDVDAYRAEVDRLARTVKDSLPKDAKAEQRLAALNRFLFEERGYHGSRADYYSRNNSYLNEVIDDREGIPITLAVLYMELARRLDLRVVGVGLPGHFVVRHEPPGGKSQLIDVFEGGKLLSREEAGQRVLNITGLEMEEKHLATVGTKAILARMLHNLVNLAGREKDRDGMLRYLDAILVIDPEAHEERWARAVFRWQAGLLDRSAEDCDWLLKREPEGMDLNRVRELRRMVSK